MQQTKGNALNVRGANMAFRTRAGEVHAVKDAQGSKDMTNIRQSDCLLGGVFK
jgi:hypothetical protein